VTVTATHEPEQGVIHLTVTISLPEAVGLVAQLGAIIDQATVAPVPAHDGYRIGGRAPVVEVQGRPATVPHGGRWARTGELCRCGRQALVVYEYSDGRPAVGDCGEHGGQR
jgi:hypothetical protein